MLPYSLASLAPLPVPGFPVSWPVVTVAAVFRLVVRTRGAPAISPVGVPFMVGLAEPLPNLRPMIWAACAGQVAPLTSRVSNRIERIFLVFGLFSDVFFIGGFVGWFVLAAG